MRIEQGNLTDPKIQKLLKEHLTDSAKHSPPESIHALDFRQLQEPEVSFWSVWDDDELLGCGALKELGAKHGEIKSMRTAINHRKKGVAKYVLKFIIEEANRRGYTRLSLETGSMSAFKPARKLYAQFGFTQCGPFADYVDDSNSVYMTRKI